MLVVGNHDFKNPSRHTQGRICHSSQSTDYHIRIGPRLIDLRRRRRSSAARLDRGGWFGGGGLGHRDLGQNVPGPSNYPVITGSSAPEPAPSALGYGSAFRHPIGYGSAAGGTAARRLQRQHRSMDGLGLMEGFEESAYGGLSPFSGPQASTSQAFSVPLAVSTQMTSHNDYRAPLSNPVPSQHNFWNSQGMLGANQYEPTSTSRLPSGMSIAAEFDQLKMDYSAAIEKLNQTMNSIKTFWSPELKRERQMRREEASRIAQLERMLTTGGGGGSSADIAQLRLELAARDERIRQLTSTLDDARSGNPSAAFSDSRIRELEETIRRLQNILANKELMGSNPNDPNSRYAIENALRRVDEKQSRIVELEDELMRVRLARSNQPRDFTDKNLSGHEMVTMRMKLERSEVELAERKAELSACQTRMHTAEEGTADMRAHLQLLKDQLTNREQHNTLLQGDVDALRLKLDSKNKQLEQKEERILALEKEVASLRADISDKTEAARQSENRISQMMGRIDGLETNLREKEQELDKAKIKLLSHPDIIKEKELTERIEQGERERVRLQEHIDQLRRNAEKERLEQQQTYQNELRQLRANNENLQKELSDRDVLLESQNEKIGDMGRDVNAAKMKLEEAMVDKGADELRREVEGARGEVEKLLKMVKQLEKENAALSSQCKQLAGAAAEKRDVDGNTLDRNAKMTAGGGQHVSQANLRKRIEELEEALQESVTITAEREIHLAQQKQHFQQVNQQLSEARREIVELRQRNSTVSTGDVAEREQMMRAIEAERRQHLEQLLQLKQEALLAAIGEKDAHLALLEKARGPRDEIETIRRHKDALMRKLKQENERRALVVRPESAASMVQPGASVIPGAPLPLLPPSGILPPQNVPDVDENDGIWA
ncbi:unnamed protein product [Caenorhabditis auriculariae]|uniref:Uncharacterized protein n=1 Tax=Caenorhabditis auriculariae TaxID=2777116 RepID=A0A8S1H8Q9_9PELO|nr:unnamed protein product [Caenorhabditis auriculariae]